MYAIPKTDKYEGLITDKRPKKEGETGSGLKKTNSKTKRSGGQITFSNNGELSQYGYKNVVELSQEKRQHALKKAMNEFFSSPEKKLSLQRKLNALSIVNRNTNPKLSKIYRADHDWVKSMR